MNIEPILAFVREAGAAIMDVYARDFEVSLKSDRSPLTEADSAAHQILANRLQEAYPGIPLLSEESTEVAPFAERKRWQRYWLVDPLDGTREFVKRNGQFTVNVAYMERGHPVAGVVYAPARDWMYWGMLGSGACKAVAEGGAAPISCSPLPETGELRVVASNSHLSPETRTYIDDLRSQYDEISFVPMGSSLKICLVAEGSADLYPRLGPTMEWDTAAAHAILNAAGGRLVSHETNEELRYNKESLRNGWFVAKAGAGGRDGSSASPAEAQR